MWWSLTCVSRPAAGVLVQHSCWDRSSPVLLLPPQDQGTGGSRKVRRQGDGKAVSLLHSLSYSSCGTPLATSRCADELQSWGFPCLVTKGSFYSFDHFGLPRAREKWKKLWQIHLSKRSYEDFLWSGFQAKGLCGIVMTDWKITVSQVKICAEELSKCFFRVEPILIFEWNYRS